MELTTEIVRTNKISGVSSESINSNIDNMTAANISTTNYQTTNIIADELTSDKIVTLGLNIFNNLIMNNSTINTLNAASFSIPTLTSPNIVVNKLVLPNTSLTSLNSTSSFSKTLNAQNISATNIDTSGLQANSISTSNFSSVTNSTQELPPTPPDTLTLKGRIGLNDLFVGIGGIPKISFTTESQLPRILGYNIPLGAIDSGTGFGGIKAMLSMCSSQAPVRTLRFEEDGNLAIYNPAGSVLWSSGTGVSDRKFKKNIQLISKPIDKIREIECFYYKYKDCESRRRVGMSAQSVRKVQPEAVKEDINGILRLEMERCIPLLLNALHELKSLQDKFL